MIIKNNSKLSSCENIFRLLSNKISIFEINNDFSKDGGTEGNIGNKKLYTTLIQNFIESTNKTSQTGS